MKRFTRNPITSIGVFLTTISAVLFLLFFVLDIFELPPTNPYLGIIFFLILPGIFLLGLTLIPVGIGYSAWRVQRGLPPSQWRLPHVDLNNPTHRLVVGVVTMLTLINIIIISMAGYRGVVFMDSPEFCGGVCHTVMEPEYTAYLDGPHSRVECVSCHIGPGASWLVKAKIDGLRQVISVATNSYQRPLPSPVKELRPARDTCEHCHWPDKFTGSLVRTIPTFKDDQENTPSHMEMELHVGGGGWRFGGPQGIHWHTSANHKVEYITTDEKRETIPWVRLTDASGTVTDFKVDDFSDESVAASEQRTMDCVDCHNRPSHRFAPSAEKAVDTAMYNGQIPTNLPFVRREAVAMLKEAYSNRVEAESAIEEKLQTFYARNYPDLVKANDGRILQAVAGIKRTYTHNIFPDMNLTWGTHANHLGHEDSPGCFRCHDDEHKAADGRVIRQDCDLCHE